MGGSCFTRFGISSHGSSGVVAPCPLPACPGQITLATATTLELLNRRLHKVFKLPVVATVGNRIAAVFRDMMTGDATKGRRQVAASDSGGAFLSCGGITSHAFRRVTGLVRRAGLTPITNALGCSNTISFPFLRATIWPMLASVEDVGGTSAHCTNERTVAVKARRCCNAVAKERV